MAESERLELERRVNTKSKKFSTQYRKEMGGLLALPFLNAFYPFILFLCCFCLIIGNQAVQLLIHNPQNCCKNNQENCNTEACCCKWHLGNNVIQGTVGKSCNKDGKGPYRHHFGEELSGSKLGNKGISQWREGHLAKR